jgi:hypothetical protein
LRILSVLFRGKDAEIDGPSERDKLRNRSARPDLDVIGMGSYEERRIKYRENQ